MPVIKLTPEMLGEYNDDGSLGKRPSQDILGNDITALHATVKRVRLGGKKYFVTIPIGKDHPDNVYELASTPTVPSAPKTKD
jgi:hypothetical protein